MKTFHINKNDLRSIAKWSGTLFALFTLISLAFPAYSTSADGTILLRGINFTEFSPWGNLVVLIPLIILGIMFSNLGYKAKLVLNMLLCAFGAVSIHNANVAARVWIYEQATGFVRTYGTHIVYGILLLCSCLCFYFYCNKKRDFQKRCEYYKITVKQEEI